MITFYDSSPSLFVLLGPSLVGWFVPDRIAYAISGLWNQVRVVYNRCRCEQYPLRQRLYDKADAFPTSSSSLWVFDLEGNFFVVIDTPVLIPGKCLPIHPWGYFLLLLLETTLIMSFCFQDWLAFITITIPGIGENKYFRWQLHSIITSIYTYNTAESNDKIRR